MASAGAERVPVTSVRADLPELVIRNVTDRGTLGKRFKVLVNHVPVKILPDRRTFYRCRIDVMNERGDTVRDMSLCRALAKAWSKFERSPLYKRPYTYDASHLIFLTEPLDKEVYEDQLTIRDDGPYSSGGQRVLNVVLKAAGVVDLGKLVNVKGGRKGFHPEDITSSLQFCNVTLRHFPSQSHFMVGNSMFSMEDSKMIVALGSSGVDLHIGSYTSCRLLENGLTLNIDVSNTLMYTPGEVLPIVCNITKQRMDSRVRIPQSKYDAVLEHFYGLKINYAFPGGQKRGCRVYGLSKHSISEIEFELDGKPVSVKSYFENKYGCEFLYPNLQCFNSSNKAGRDSWMPIEFSTICAKQIYRKALEAEQVRKMIDITCQAPSLRMDKIRSAYERFKSPKRLYDEFSIVPTGQFMTVEARKLPDESLKFGKDSRTPIVTPVNGAWNLHNKVLMRRNTIAIWDVVVYQAQNSLRDNDLSKFLDTLRGALSDVGIDSLPPGRVHRLPDPCRDLGSTISSLSGLLSRQEKLNMVLVVLPRDNDSEIYRATKLLADTQLGIPTQCVASRNVVKSNINTCKNIALKINLRLGGVNYMLNAGIECVSACPTMVIGADVSHPESFRGHSGSSVSVASVVGSMNSSCTTYAASVRPQMPNTESFSVLQEQIADIYAEFHSRNKTLPDNIIYFRDGVSEGDISYATRSEINCMLIAARAVNPGWVPKITYVSCNKRHHTRLIPTAGDLERASRAPQQRGGNVQQEFPFQNVPPGTVVDGGVTNVGFKNFYITPHSGIKGTSRPIHYQVLHDDINISMDQLQRLVYQLSHLYGRSTTIVSYITPVYYAHIASRRASSWYSARAKVTSRSISTAKRMDDLRPKMIEDIKLHPNHANKLWFI